MKPDLSAFEGDLARMRALSSIPAVAALADDLETALGCLRRVYGAQRGARANEPIFSPATDLQEVTQDAAIVDGRPDGMTALREVSGTRQGQVFTIPDLVPMLKNVGWESTAVAPLESVRTIVRRMIEANCGVVEKVDHGRYRFIAVRSPQLEIVGGEP